MDRSEAIWYLQPIADSASLERYKEALNMAIAALREQEQKSPCSLCGYGGKHLDAPPCTKCPAHPKEQEQSQWVSVKERLPEDDHSVNKHIEGEKFGFLTVLAYNGVVKQTNRFFCNATQFGLPKTCGWEWASSNVTHWMPLPEPPKEGAEG